ncbi:hypothetical protein H5P27_07410 [Pelagicoccus albus]|uniref:Uncharacterized protein n=1 Tax=Pelagicoccus albus TaxID=415222 RepID=A0A7X1E878_9BACT|nr:hypothetical protein [Pelagicoccus albus]
MNTLSQFGLALCSQHRLRNWTAVGNSMSEKDMGKTDPLETISRSVL